MPELPWQKVGTELFQWKINQYLLIVDYYSRYIEISKLSSGTTADDIINHTKSIFARHGIPEVVYSDNGPQFRSEAYKQFAAEYQFTHVTSSPYFPQSNREAERAVGTIKSLLKKEGALPILSSSHCEFYGARLCADARKTISLAPIHSFTKQIVPSMYEESLT